MKRQKNPAAGPQTLSRYRDYLSSLGYSYVTGWRMRRRGWIKTITICGRVFVTREEIERFEASAAAGAFMVPPRRSSPAQSVNATLPPMQPLSIHAPQSMTPVTTPGA
jgi:hypothetical protein